MPVAGHPDASTIDWRPLWQAHAASYRDLVRDMAPTGEQAARRELLFCLLGGHAVSYELSLSATERCWELDVFDKHWDTSHLEQRLAEELNTAQFLPLKLDGMPRRYRYPRRKATLIAAAREWLLARGKLTVSLSRIECEAERRRFLCSCPGIGPKTASWLLRNLGFAHNLAVLDVHVLRALAAAGRLDSARLPRDYERVEAAFLSWCEELEAPPAAFDLFLWEFQRGTMSVVA